MASRLRSRVTAAVLAASTATLGLATVLAAPAAHAATAFPSHVFAPYFEAYSSDDPAVVAQNSGANYLSMAFIQTASSGSCTVYWDGDTGQPIGSTFASSISTIRSRGGDVIPSFGGYTADTTNTEIADSCTSVSSIASAIENVISKYNLSRIDFDVEQNSLTNSAGIDRRNKALKQVEAWATAAGRPLQVSYTLPTNTDGLDSGGQGVLSNAVSNGTRVDVVNIMTFDYYTGGSHEMAQATETAGAGLESYLASLYPSKSSSQLWAMVGVTEMPGIDDYGSAETFTQADAGTVLSWAKAKGINEISMWASERDNGGCPGTGGSDTCSGISQPAWYFSKAWAPFTSGTTTPSNDFSLAASPTSGSVTAGSSATATVSTAVTSGSSESVSLSASGLPTGASAAFSPASVNSGSSSTLTITTSASTPAGTYTVTVNGSAASGSHTTTYSLTVTSGTVTNDFSVSLSPTSGSTTAGSSATTTVSTAVTAGSAQTVSLSASGLPSGVTASFSPASVTAGSTSTLTLATASTTTAGTYTITVIGTAASGSHSTAYKLTVTAAGGGTCNPAWSATTSYVPNDLVSYGGHNYTSLYWSTDVQPGSAIAWNIWQDNGAC